MTSTTYIVIRKHGPNVDLGAEPRMDDCWYETPTGSVARGRDDVIVSNTSRSLAVPVSFQDTDPAISPKDGSDV